MLFCPTEVCHLGAAGCPAENCDKSYDQQFAKVVPRVVSTRIGDVIEGGEKDVHAGNGLQKGDPRPRIHHPENSKTSRVRSNPKRDSPAMGRVPAFAGAGLAQPDEARKSRAGRKPTDAVLMFKALVLRRPVAGFYSALETNGKIGYEDDSFRASCGSSDWVSGTEFLRDSLSALC
jgi:hypothetical protein